MILRYISSGAMFDKIEMKMFKVANSATEEGNMVQKVESVFKNITITYKPQEDGGIGKKAAGTPGADITCSWDIPAGKVS